MSSLFVKVPENIMRLIILDRFLFVHIAFDSLSSIIIILLRGEFFTPALADGFPLEFE